MTDDGFVVDRPCGAKHDFPDVGRNGSAQVPEAKSGVVKSPKGHLYSLKYHFEI